VCLDRAPFAMSHRLLIKSCTEWDRKGAIARAPVINEPNKNGAAQEILK
jgi:hypothetical protein